MQAAQVKAYESGAVLYMAMELSNSKWKLGALPKRANIIDQEW